MTNMLEIPVDEKILEKANDWWENLPAITKIAIHQNL